MKNISNGDILLSGLAIVSIIIIIIGFKLFLEEDIATKEFESKCRDKGGYTEHFRNEMKYICRDKTNTIALFKNY